MSLIEIRNAFPADRDVIVEFNCQLAAETENKQLDPASIRGGVEKVLADASKGRYLLACQGERVVGQLMLTGEWSDWRDGRIWWLQSVFVARDFRRQGVFRMLYDHVWNEARSNPEVIGLRLYVESENHRAQQTYRSLGLATPGYFVMEDLFE